MEIPVVAYFAELNQNNVVLRVISVGDWVTVDESGVEYEELGQAFCRKLFGQDTIWMQTSYNTIAGQHTGGKTPFRKNYAGVGFTYDPQRNAFIPPQPQEPGWILDEDKCIWRNFELEAAEEATKIKVDRV